MNPIGAIAVAVSNVIDEIHTSDKERLDAEIELRKIDAGLLQGQMEVNKVEAASSSLFIGGWRPACGWIGAAAMGYQFLLYPLLVWAWSLMQARSWVPAELNAPPMLDTDALWVVLTGMLGIAGARTVEKIKGVAR